VLTRQERRDKEIRAAILQALEAIRRELASTQQAINAIAEQQSAAYDSTRIPIGLRVITESSDAQKADQYTQNKKD